MEKIVQPYLPHSVNGVAVHSASFCTKPAALTVWSYLAISQSQLVIF